MVSQHVRLIDAIVDTHEATFSYTLGAPRKGHRGRKARREFSFTL